MSHGKKFGLMAMLIMTAWLMPLEALGYEKDLYQRKSITGRVYFAYETVDNIYNDRHSPSSKFQKTYSLDTRGNLLSRRTIIYDAGATWNFDDYNANTTTNNSQSTRYYARTTILPLSAIPLTLHWSNDTSSSSMSSDKPSATNYGLNWSARFRTLPTTRISADTTENKSNARQTRSNRYVLQMNKELGPTENYLDYDRQDSEVKPSMGTTSNDKLNISNKTRIGRSTALTAGATRGRTTGSDRSNNTTVQGLSLTLNSKPSDEFTQAHNYDFYSNKTITSTQEGSNYTGSLDYSTGNAFRSNLSLSIHKLKDFSGTIKTRNDNLLSQANIRLSITTHWFLSQQVFVETIKTDTNTSAANLNDHSILKSLTSLNYKRGLKWGTLSGHYGAGYTKESYRQGQPSGKGLVQDVAIGLNSINVIKYAIFNANANSVRTQNTIGKRNHVTETYAFNGFNAVGRKYAAISSNYSKTFNTSWNSQYDSNSEIFGFAAGSSYFRYTALDYSLTSNSSFNYINGASKNRTNKYSLSHKRPLLGGDFSSLLTYVVNNTNARKSISDTDTTHATLGYSRKILDGTFSSNVDYNATHQVQDAAFRDDTSQGLGLSYGHKVYSGDLMLAYKTSTQNIATKLQKYGVTQTNYNVTYTALLFRRVSWKAYYSKEMMETGLTNNFRYITYYRNALMYQLRSWMLTAEQSHRLTEDQSGLIITENRMMLTAERTFFRVF